MPSILETIRQYGYHFPPVESALKEPDGLLASGGDLNPGRILQAYSQGIFPWYSPEDPILWWSPDPRCVLFTDELHISRSMRKWLNQHSYQVTLDKAFPAVIAACAAPRAKQAGTWINADIQNAYCQLHDANMAHSVEVWDKDQLVGGLYGIAIGSMFFGESMFSKTRNTSKLAFITLVEKLRAEGFSMIDCQVYNPHLETLGARCIPREEFIAIIQRQMQRPNTLQWELP